jgi:hypothetical protein
MREDEGGMRIRKILLSLLIASVALGSGLAQSTPQPGSASAFASEAARAPKRAFPWDKRVRAAKRYARRRGGSVSFAVISETGRLRGYRRGRRYPSASVVKAMLMVSYLRKKKVRRRRLRGSEKALISPMITRSDNGAASAMYSRVGPGGLEHLARAARMRRFEASSVWGGCQITARDQAKFMYRLRRLTPRRHRGYALGILRRIIPGQRWGIPPGKPKRWSIHFKGGWYPGGYGWRVHQVALLRRNGRRLALAVLTEGGPSLSYGAETITGITKRLLRGYNRYRPRRRDGRR